MTEEPIPIPMLLWCPMCSERHIDEPPFDAKPHKVHACQGCGLTWRPAVVPTMGVQFLPGFKNEPKVEPGEGERPDPVAAPGTSGTWGVTIHASEDELPDIDALRRVYRRAQERTSERGRPGSDPHHSGLNAVSRYCVEWERARQKAHPPGALELTDEEPLDILLETRWNPVGDIGEWVKTPDGCNYTLVQRAIDALRKLNARTGSEGAK